MRGWSYYNEVIRLFIGHIKLVQEWLIELKRIHFGSLRILSRKELRFMSYVWWDSYSPMPWLPNDDDTCLNGAKPGFFNF
jgi:hypothetical protein